MDKLYRSSTDKIISGVCGGLGEYFKIDPVIIRLIWVVSVLVGGFGILAYIIAAIIIPLEPYDPEKKQRKPAESSVNATPGIFPLIIGIFLLAIGVAALGNNLGWHMFSWAKLSRLFWIFFPTVFIILGILLILRGMQAKNEKERNPIAGSSYEADLPNPDGEKKKTKAAKPKKEAAMKEEPSYAKKDTGSKKKKGATKEKKKEEPEVNSRASHSHKKLYRDMDNRMVSGVCSGIAKYLDMDVSIIRVLWVVMTIMTGIIGGVIAYIAVVFVVPPK